MAMTGWQRNAKHWRWEYADESGRVLFWLSTEAAGTEYDSREGFVTADGERIPPLPDDAYSAVADLSGDRLA
jgi:hypothetical protein